VSVKSSARAVDNDVGSKTFKVLLFVLLTPILLIMGIGLIAMIISAITSVTSPSARNLRTSVPGRKAPQARRPSGRA
jgi:hypothetical protein